VLLLLLLLFQYPRFYYPESYFILFLSKKPLSEVKVSEADKRAHGRKERNNQQ
jgi:hypothetical protein